VAKEMDITSRLNNKINEDSVKEAARGQYPVRQELKDEKEYPWGSGGSWRSRPEIGGWGVLPLGLGST